MSAAHKFALELERVSGLLPKDAEFYAYQNQNIFRVPDGYEITVLVSGEPRVVAFTPDEIGTPEVIENRILAIL